MFPAGLWVAGALRSDSAPIAQLPVAQPPVRAAADPAMRNPYSATIRTDPSVLGAQRDVVEALERACERERAQCTEAAAARRYLEDRLAEGR